MVRRLIEEQDVRISEQGLREEHLDLDRSLEGRHLLVVELRLNAEAVEERFRVALGLPAVHFREFALELGRADAILLREVRLRIDRVLLLHDLIETLISHDDRVQHVVLVVFEVVLLEK